MPHKTIMIETPENIIPIKCDIHGWMRAYVGVFDHPYFALTDENGDFFLGHLFRQVSIPLRPGTSDSGRSGKTY